MYFILFSTINGIGLYHQTNIRPQAGHKLPNPGKELKLTENGRLRAFLKYSSVCESLCLIIMQKLFLMSYTVSK